MLVKANRDFGNISNIVVPITIGQGGVSARDQPFGNIGAADVLEDGRIRNRLFDFILANQNELFARSGLPSDVASNLAGLLQRSEESRVGKECVSTCRSRWAPFH